MRHKEETLVDAFCNRVEVDDVDECWLWTGYLEKNGYGRLTRAANVRWEAHRLSYYLWLGKIPSGLFICHRCDNRWCVNPSHLFLGTIRDNRADCVQKNRHAFGERQGLAKLTTEDILAIRRLHVPNLPAFQKSEFSYKGLAKRFGVDPALIQRIVLRRIWKRV